MSRRRKDFAIRQADILDAAWELFARQGYARVGVQAIIDQLGISKGTFYHYFPSKEAVFDAVVGRFCDEVVDATVAAMAEPGLSALDRLDLMTAVPKAWKLRHLGMMATVSAVAYTDTHASVMHHLVVAVNARLAPPLADVIRQGVAEGVFTVGDPEAAAEFYLAFQKTLGDVVGPAFLAASGDPTAIARVAARAAEGTRVLDAILGAAPGMVKLVDRETLERVAQGFQEHRAAIEAREGR